jgi:hypothetical protein
LPVAYDDALRTARAGGQAAQGRAGRSTGIAEGES